MDVSAPTPRVNGELLSRFVGRKVLLVVKVGPVDPQSRVMHATASDNMQARARAFVIGG